MKINCKNSILKVFVFFIVFMLCSQIVLSADAGQPKQQTGTLRDKIAQMIMSTPGKNGEFISAYHVGGIILMGDDEGIGGSADQIKARVASYKSKSSVPLLVASDIEGGAVNRIKQIHDFSAPGSMGDPGQITGTLSKAGSVMKGLGIDMDLAPVVDVSSSGLMADSKRSFSGDPATVKQKASAYILGLHKAGVAATVKHFPGYGNEARNSDLQFVKTSGIIGSHKEVFDSLKSETDAIMMSNIVYESEDSGRQAVVSPSIVGLARQNFNGVIISDDLTAVSIWEVQYKKDSKRLAVDAVNAGVDILLLVNDKKSSAEASRNIKDFIDGIEEAVRSGAIPESRIDQSLARINALKNKYVSGGGGKGGEGFRFIVLSDANPSYDKEELNAKFPNVLRGIPGLKPSFVIHAGDMIGGGKEHPVTKYDAMWAPFFQAIKAITSANIPYLPCPGNHDKGFGIKNAAESYGKNWLANQPAPMATSGNYPYYYSFDVRNNHFIILDSSNIKLGSTQIQWLEQDLATANGKQNIFAILHVPFMSSGMKHSGQNADKSALDMLEKAGVKYVFTGHNHVYREHTSGNLKQITVGSAADDPRGEKDNMFLVVDVLGEGNIKLYPASYGSGFTKTLDGQDIPAAPSGAAPSFDPDSMMGDKCIPGDGMSSLLSGDGISYESYPYKGGVFHAIIIDPNKFEVKVVSAKKATGKAEATVAEIVMNTPGAVAGVNGGFFEGSGRPTNTIVEDNKLIGGVKEKFHGTFVNENGRYKLISLSELKSYSSDKIAKDINSAMTGISLVSNGNNVGSTGDKAPRTGICITKDGAIKLLASNGVQKGSSLVGGHASINEFAREAIDRHGCIDGINIDGGGSTTVEYHINGQDVSLKGERNAAKCRKYGKEFPCQRPVGDAMVVVPKQAIKGPATQEIASSQTSSSTPTGAFAAIDSLTGMAAASNCPDFSKIDDKDKKVFFETYWNHALQASGGSVELAKFTLAQAALESGWGKSDLTKDANNFFGIKGEGDAGSVMKRTREVYGGKETYVEAKFAKYSSAEASFKSHNELLMKDRYAKKREQLFGNDDMTKLTADQILESTWKGGYATDPKYIEIVTPIIRELENAVSCLGTTALAQPTPVQQAECVCEQTTTNTIIGVSSPQTGQTADTGQGSEEAQESATGSAVEDETSGFTYDFSAIDSKYRDFGAKRDVSKLSKYDKEIQEANQKFGVPVEVIKGVMMVESNGEVFPARGSLCNSAGYCGLMQINKGKCGEKSGCDWANFEKGVPKDQIFGGTWYLGVVMKDKKVGTMGTPDYFYWIAAGYNGGPGSAVTIRNFAAQRLGIPPEQVKWNDVTIEDARKNQQEHFPSIPSKTEEIFYYPSKVMSVIQALGVSSGMPMAIQETTTQQCAYDYVYDYISIGKYYINPSFTTQIDYNMEDYKLLGEAAKKIIDGCGDEDSDDLAECVKDEVKSIGTLNGGEIELYNGPCDYAENMFSDLVEWLDACSKSKSDNCVCEIPLEYEYQKKDTDEEITITASGSTITLRGMSQTIGSSISGAKTITTKTADDTLYVKKNVNMLAFVDDDSGSDCKLDKRAYKFCAQTKNVYVFYDEAQKKLMLKPIQYKFALEFPK